MFETSGYFPALTLARALRKFSARTSDRSDNPAISPRAAFWFGSSTVFACARCSTNALAASVSTRNSPIIGPSRGPATRQPLPTGGPTASGASRHSFGVRMRATVGRSIALLTLVLFCAPAGAHADATWTCNSGSGWLAGGGQRIDAPRTGADPCPTNISDSIGAAGAPGSLAGAGSIAVDGGTGAQTTDARQPRATVQA